MENQEINPEPTPTDEERGNQHIEAEHICDPPSSVYEHNQRIFCLSRKAPFDWKKQDTPEAEHPK